jgi:patatin-like phospholipase/acyl hydrolase
MAELIVDQHNSEALSTSENTRKTHRTRDRRLFFKPFLVKITQCRADIRFQIV